MDSFIAKLWTKVNKKEYAYPFVGALVIGLLTHFPIMVNKWPNADSMANFYSNQNMITSGRWFLGTACGISSFYDLNWVIGILSAVYLALAAVFLCEFFEIRSKVNRVLVAALLVTFPAVCATFSYMYTMDGYMIGFVLSIVAAYLTRKYKLGFIAGSICLCFSLGIYQAYLAVTILLCIFDMLKECICKKEIRALWSRGWRYLVMGISGGAGYMIVLKILLVVSGKELDTYQGINQMGRVDFAQLPSMLLSSLKDFAAFALKGNIFINNGFSLVSVVLLSVVALIAALLCWRRTDGQRKWFHYLFVILFTAMIPVATNIIMLVSPEVYYHLLMRMQWILFPIGVVVLADLLCVISQKEETEDTDIRNRKNCFSMISVLSIVLTLASASLSYSFVLQDNIAYFNMHERYEKTYAYCLRLLDRMEETPGYYPTMTVAMIGVIDESKYPDTDITKDVTEKIWGTGGSTHLYKASQYAAFMRHYMHTTFDVISGDELVEIYYSPEYREMDSFPAENSMKVVDGILYIKTEAKE